MNLSKGTQIIYIPTHAENNETHPDCETGFVTNQTKPNAVFCRYWRNDGLLRTTSCSELTPLYAIVVKDSVPQHIIETTLKTIGTL